MAVMVPEVEACTGTMRPLSKRVRGCLLDLVPHPHQQFAGRTRVLAHRNDELWGKARVNDGVRLDWCLFSGGWMPP